MWAESYLATVLIICNLCVLIVSGFNNIQPKIYNDDGHLIIESAKDRNISFNLPGEGRFVANETDVTSYLEAWQTPTEVDISQSDKTLADEISDVRKVLTGGNGLFRRVDRLGNSTRFQDMLPIYRLRRRVYVLTTTVAQIEAKLKTNECSENPCQNGGICVDLYDDFRCKCPENWQGKTCNVDVDECYRFTGTDLGCQNNAVCVNTIGSYRCECTQGWKGLHCTNREVDCYTSPKELCGNGVCVSQSNDLGYSCICNTGWKSNNDTPACTEDIDECAELKHRCVSKCINLPGDFMCGPCPAGYTGDGITCRDIDECETNNGGCSLAPHVRCINTEGSFRCGNCPMGYSGDGKTCDRDENSCQNYGICHPQATCRYVSNSVICTCPPGMTGNGYGPTGCAVIGVEACNPNQCKNGGTCRPHGASYICICPPGFEDEHCQIPNPCKSNPCKNGATCLPRFNRNYKCLCTSGFQGTNCEDDRVICGTTLRLDSGSITYPRSGNYKPNERCAWVIQTYENKILHVTFTKFDLQEHPSCLKDFLQIHDGRSAAYPLIGQFCGNSLPKGGNFYSTHNMVYFWFRSDAILQKSGFALSWNTIDPICGGTIEFSSHGVIASPGYPFKTPPNRDCEWILEAPPGKALEIVFYEVDLPQNGNCDGDFLEVLDDDIEKRSLKKFCNKTTSAPIKSGSNKVIINFHTDNSSFDSCFQLHYSIVEALQFCGGVFTQPEGGFESPKFGNFAGSAIICNYLIQTSRDTVIHLDFPSLYFGHVPDCAYNSLMIFDGKTDDDPVLDIWCRSGTPINYTSTSNTMLVRYKFSSDLNRPKFGFRAHYKTGCGGVYKGLSGTFVSPNSPQEYPPNLNCFYTIEVPQGFAVTLRMEYFHLSHKYFWIPNLCNNTDHITVYSPVVNNASLIGMFCKEFPSVIVSKYNRMIIQFVTDDVMQFSGFKALYESEEIGCGAVLSEPNGTISFVNSKQLEECEWVLNAPENHHIFINFEKFHILDNQSCKTNFLRIKDLNENIRDKHLGIFCGQNQARSGTFSTNRLSIVFVAETESPTDEFSATYQFLDTSTSSCGSRTIEFVAPSGNLYSPGWPGKYLPKMNCSWIIRAPIGHRIVLDVKTFSLEPSSANYDYVEIRDGYVDAPPIGRFYGVKIPSRIMSFTNSFYITFKTDDSINKEGFHFEWQTTTMGCGGTLNSQEGFIIPPHYPDLISPGAQCDWHIIVNPGSSITANVTSQNFQELGGCDTKHIIVFNGDNPSADRLKPNCSEEALHYTSTKNHMLIRYETEANEESSFIMNYKTKCGGELRDVRGVVESPNFPYDYPAELDCKWDIISTKGNKIVLAVSHLNLEDDTCYFDKLYISDIKAGEVLHEYKICYKEDLARVITALGDTLRVHFLSDNDYSGTGFRLEYELQGCSKHLSSPMGFAGFQSPNYPYAINVHCEWVIEAPYGQLVQLKINPINLEGSTDDCSKNGLIVYSDETRSKTLAKFCTTHTDQVVLTSVGSKIFLTFLTDEVRAKKNFRATYNFRRGKCGGIYNAPSGYIISPNFPSKYPKGASCTWLVIGGQHHTVDLTFEHFSVPNVTNCEDSFLEVYDGSEKKAEHLVLRHCGTLLPLNNLLQSKQEQMLIVFKASNITEPGFGFKIFYKRNCGIKIVDSANGFIQKGFNDNNCLWTISSTNSSARVTLHFSHVECKCATDVPDYCERNMGVQVYDGDSIEAPLKTSFCTKHPLTIYSNGPVLTIRAVGGHFVAYYNLFENACGGKLTSIRGEFASPKYPNSYPPNVECVWEIIAEEGNTIELSFNKFQIHKASEQCNEDYVEIRVFGEGGKLLGAFCGNDPPQPLRIYQRAWIKFRSDDDFVGDGFLATWSYAHESEINGTFGILKSPPIENFNIDPENYKWRIVVPRGNLIEINFNQYVDGLQLFDGYDETAPPVEFEYKSTITSSTNIVYITSENNICRPFLIKWEAVPINTIEATGDDTTLTKKIIVIPMNEVVNITSPGYPKGYANDLDFEWILRPNDSSIHVVLTFYGAELEQSADCGYDYIKIYSSENMFDWTLMQTYCNEPIRMRPIKVFHGTPYLKLVFHSDVNRNGTGFLFRATTFCGSDMTEPEGVIKGVTGFFNMHLPRNCTWSIHVTPGRRIKFLFKKMEIPAPTDHNSCDEYVSIRDGFDEGAALLGQGMFCKGSNLTIPETTTNRAFVRAFIVHFQDMDWVLQYTSVSDNCGGTIHITKEKNSTNITTPNYPDVPTPYSECVWILLGPPGETLHLSFPENFDLYPSSDCATEFVEVRDGSTSISKLIKKFCRKLSLIPSTGNALYIKYFTNTSEPRNGFKAPITLGKCGGTFSGLGFQNDITSKNYPSLGGYPSNSVCEYKIMVWRLQGINITFNDVHLPVRPNRNESDHLTFYVEDDADVENSTMVEVATIYGDNAPPFLEFSSNEVFFKFFSYQPNTQYRGYSFSLKRIRNTCHRAINAESGQIVFPRRTSRENNANTFCTWFITVPRGRRINLVVDDFDAGEGGLSDYSLTFYNDILRTHKILSTTNIADIKSVNSTSNKMVIRLFNSNERRIYAKLNFTSYELSYCPTDITQDNGTIMAPDVSENYYCTSEYRLDQGQTIAFKISELIVASNNTPSVNILRQSNSLVIKGKYFVMFESSRNVTDTLVVVAFREGTIYMVQNEMKKINKILIHYKKYDCGGEYVANTDTIITKPEFNRHNETMDCAWSLQIPYQQKYNLNASFSFNPDCEKEYILIYKGIGPTSPQLAKICRNGTLSRSISSDIYVHYHKDATIAASKFEIILTKSFNCGGTIYHNYGYPSDVAIDKSDYRNNLECVWNLEYKLGFTSEVSFTNRFFIEDSVNCTKDYVEIRGFLGNEWKTYPRFCGRHVPEKFNVTHTKLMVIFRTDNNTVGDGFRLIFKMMCGGVFNATDKPQTINFDVWDIYNFQLQCNYTFRTYTKNRIRVHINSLEMGGSKGCADAFLDVYKGSRLIHVRKYCSAENLKDIYSTDSVNLFVQGNQDTVPHFSFTYQLETCGGVVTEDTTIQSLSHESREDHYANDINCLWNITGPPGFSVFIEFKYFDFHIFACNNDYVDIFAGHELSDANKKAHICAKPAQQNLLYKIPENIALVQAVSDSSIRYGKGFSAEIRFRKKCDENVLLSHQNSTYTFDRFANGYEPNLNCLFVFSAPDGNYVTMNFHSFNLTKCGETNCTCDFLETRNGDAQNLPLDIFCGDKLPPIVISSRNKLFVHFASSEVAAGQGFNATVSFIPSPCGPTEIIMNETKEVVIKSPDLNGYYPPNTVCHWTLEYPLAIELHFDEFELEEPQESGQCLDFLEISFFAYRFLDVDDPNQKRTEVILCGNRTSNSYFMTNKNPELTFRSNSELQRRGFKATLRSANACNVTYTALSGQLYKRPDEDECILYFKVPTTYTLTFTIEDILFDSNCSRMIEFYDENTKQQVQTTCGSPLVAFINSNNVKVKFSKDLLEQFTLQMTYFASNSGLGCGGNIYGYQGKIPSPLYPKTDGNYSCQWNIQVPSNTQFYFNFLVFDMGSMGTCSYNYVTLFEVSATGVMTEVRRYCGDVKPGPYIGKGKRFSLVYHKVLELDGTGWVLAYSTYLL